MPPAWWVVKGPPQESRGSWLSRLAWRAGWTPAPWDREFLGWAWRAASCQDPRPSAPPRALALIRLSSFVNLEVQVLAGPSSPICPPPPSPAVLPTSTTAAGLQPHLLPLGPTTVPPDCTSVPGEDGPTTSPSSPCRPPAAASSGRPSEPRSIVPLSPVAKAIQGHHPPPRAGQVVPWVMMLASAMAVMLASAMASGGVAGLGDGERRCCWPRRWRCSWPRRWR